MIDCAQRNVRALIAVFRLVAGVLHAASVLINVANVLGRYFFGLCWEKVARRHTSDPGTRRRAAPVPCF
jgi:TRAP-type C4-dicarboxylate transport system permease small subunit